MEGTVAAVITANAGDQQRTSDIQVALPTGWRLRYWPTVGSTQDLARAAAAAGAPDRTIFLADEQTAGRGRHGRRWLAPPGTALTLSILFRGHRSPPHWYTMLVSMAVTDAVCQLEPMLQPRVKWPNDVMLDDRKVAGILAEAQWSDGALSAVVVGAGVNVNLHAAQLDGVGSPATSLLVAAGHLVNRGRLLQALVEWLDVWSAKPPAELHAAWERRLWGRGQQLRLADLQTDEVVVVLGVDADGALRVRAADGSERRTVTGELIV